MEILFHFHYFRFKVEEPHTAGSRIKTDIRRRERRKGEREEEEEEGDEG